MRLSKLTLTQFKNYQQLQLEMNSSIVCFAGNNGEGKTNLLDSIYYTCIGKSYFNSIEKQNILHGSSFFRIESEIDNDVLEITYQDQKKIEKNKVSYDRLSDHIGEYPVTFIAPDDNLIVLGGSELRRRSMNMMISQLQPNYMADLITYRKLLQQRNSALKQGSATEQLLQVYDSQLEPLANMIFAVRSKIITELSKEVETIYQFISKEKEQITCTYVSQLQNASLKDLFLEAREKDRMLKRTTVGIHKDDLSFKINDFPLKKYGSQGQQKSFLLAYKLAEYSLLAKHTNKQPFLLLDDIFDKLDRDRVKQLFQYLIENNIGQLFLTDTNAERLQELLSNFDAEFTIFIVENNQLTERL